MHKKHIFLRVFSKITIFACVFCAFFISPVFATLPAGYTELEYIESIGTQWIDTGVSPSADLKIRVKVKTVTDDSSIFGAGTASSNRTQLYMYANKIYLRAWSSENKFSIPYTKNNIYDVVVDFKNQKISIDSFLTDFTYDITTNINYSIWINADNVAGSVNGGVGNNVYYAFQMWNNEVLVRNMIPAKRNSDGKIGMYDTVSGTFFTNQGTGDFIAGPVVEIKIATTKMVDEEFAAAEAKLAATVQTIESVVSRTIAQTEQIQVLQDTKQTRPDESCPANMKCLLVQDEDGTPHWYPIIEP